MTASAIVPCASDRDDLLIFEVVDKIAQLDIELMAEHVEGAFGRHDQIDILIVMTDFEGATLGALVDPKALRAEVRSLKQVRRYAVVGAPKWIAAMIEFSDTFIPVNAKTFALEDRDAARAWVDGKNIQT